MILGKVCPFCHVENAPHVERCERCGRPLPTHRNQFTTTDEVAKIEPELTSFLPSVEHLGELSKDTLVLFVVGHEEPIVLEDVQDIILGRPVSERSTTRTLDLTNYEAIPLGVSRRHVQIKYVNGTFMALDLDSTNGTSLNGRFLSPARSERLRPFDQLTLGQLRIMVYFEVELGLQRKNFLLTDRRAKQPVGLTPHYLTSTIIPYIQALADIQKIIQEVRGQSIEDIQVLHLQSGESTAQVRLSLLMNDETLTIVRQLVGPWQRIYADPILFTADPNEKITPSQLNDLAASIADYLILSLSESDTIGLQEKLFAPVSFIATSNLELTLEAPSI